MYKQTSQSQLGVSDSGRKVIGKTLFNENESSFL